MNRRQFLQTAAAAPFVLRNSLANRSDKRPNIVLIMADDMGFSDIGCFGSEIATPNLDRMAQHGVRFTSFYNTARCCPTRAALLTGLYSHQAGVGHMVQDLGAPPYQGYLNDRCVTIAEALKPAGYNTLMAGKWHVGEQRPHWPTDRGFDRYFGLIAGADNYFRPVRQMALEDKSWKPSPTQKYYMTNAFTDYAVDRIGEYASKPNPFFLYLAYTAPHWPLHALPEDIARYRGNYRKGWDALREQRHTRQKRMKVVDPRWPLTPRDVEVPAWAALPNQDEFDLRMAVYAAQVDRLDRNIGRVLQKLRETGQEENTLVMFLSDNGGCAEERIKGETLAGPIGTADSFTSYGKPWANASNTPFRLYKHWVHEGGISAPFIAYWPGRIRNGNTFHRDPAHVIDLMATCIDVGAAQYPRDKTPLEGKSIAPAFEGKQRDLHDAIFWEHEGNRAVRQGQWKLVSRHPDNWELYDLDADRTELRNLAAAQPERVHSMITQYEDWAARCGVLPWPVHRPA
jgi:arylsulfatase A-like enzyme